MPGFFLPMNHKLFKPHEFECGCGKCGLGFPAMDQDFLDRLELARTLSRSKFVLTSAVRCEEHNRNVGGLDNSAHLKGLAVDIATPTSNVRYEVLYGLIKAGFKRIGIYNNFIHVDEDTSKPQAVIWG